MKTKTILLTIFVFLVLLMPVYASDANLDSSTNIVTIPRVTIDNRSAYVNVRLLLNPNGTYQILSSTAEESTNLSGDWKGTFTFLRSAFPKCDSHVNFSLTQNDNELTGHWDLDSDCIESGGGTLTGIKKANQITFSLYIFDLEIKANAIVSNDQKSITGSYSWPELDDQGTWSISRQ